MHSGYGIMNRNETFSIAFQVQFYWNPSRSEEAFEERKTPSPEIQIVSMVLYHEKQLVKNGERDRERERSKHAAFDLYESFQHEISPRGRSLRHSQSHLASFRKTLFCNDGPGRIRSLFQIEPWIMQGSFSSDLLKGILN